MDYEEANGTNIKLGNNEIYINVVDPAHRSSDSTVKLATIITPPSYGCTSRNSTSMKVAILLHGHQSHKNAIYQPLMAQALSDRGYVVVRFDFRGQGDSSSNFSIEEGRTIEQDVIDLNIMVNFIKNGSLKELINDTFNKENAITNVRTYETVDLEMIIAHSRGVLVMFQYMSENVDMCVRLLVNCCGRYDGNGLLERYTKMAPTWREDGGLGIPTLRYAEYVRCWVPTPEIISAANVKTSEFNRINNFKKVINVYGTCDTVIPMEDARKYMNTFGEKALLLLLEGSDHNFYGLKNDSNIQNLPLRKGLVNYSILFVSEFLNLLNDLESL